MSKQSRNQRRTQRALRPHTSYIRNAATGINLDPAADLDVTCVQQPINITVTSSATHSVSMGWLPCLLIEYQYVPLLASPDVAVPQTLQLMLIGEQTMIEHIATLNEGLDRALLDAQVGFRLE